MSLEWGGHQWRRILFRFGFGVQLSLRSVPFGYIICNLEESPMSIHIVFSRCTIIPFYWRQEEPLCGKYLLYVVCQRCVSCVMMSEDRTNFDLVPVARCHWLQRLRLLLRVGRRKNLARVRLTLRNIHRLNVTRISLTYLMVSLDSKRG